MVDVAKIPKATPKEKDARSIIANLKKPFNYKATAEKLDAAVAKTHNELALKYTHLFNGE
mgnify:CR=1 FL=1